LGGFGKGGIVPMPTIAAAALGQLKWQKSEAAETNLNLFLANDNFDGSGGIY
jgi:hypothetical protein